MIGIITLLSNRFVAKRAYLFLLLVFLTIGSSMLTSCASKRSVTTTHVVADTTHVTVIDTTHIVQVHDSTHVTHTEQIRERIITHYDPKTGNPTEQLIERDISRQLDSLVNHMRDSILNAIHLDAVRATADSLSHSDDHRTGSAATPTSAHIANILWALAALSLFAIIFFLIRKFLI